jgi:hypothetical protein
MNKLWVLAKNNKDGSLTPLWINFHLFNVYSKKRDALKFKKDFKSATKEYKPLSVTIIKEGINE